MQQQYPRLRNRIGLAQRLKMPLLRKLLFPLLMTLIISITTTFAQNESNYIYLSGQITNVENGTPIPGQQVYIKSNPEYSGGFNYFFSSYTDEFGFFYDTLSNIPVKGSFIIYTYDANNEKYEKEEFFRLLWSSEYYLNTSLKIPDPGSVSDFCANFESMKDTITFNFLSCFFIDKSMGENIISWRWNFGDGGISIEKNPRHLYSEPGVYDVTLTVSDKPCLQQSGVSTIVKKVKVGMDEYFHFGGHAFAGNFPVDIGTAYLYKIEEDTFIPIDTTEFDTLGYYFFYQLIEGDYKIKTFPSTSSVNAGHYLPTYYGDALLWTKSKTIQLDETGWEYDISMIQNYEYSSGNGGIDGVVTLDVAPRSQLEDVAVILFNEEDNCLTYIKSNSGGVFEFTGLAYGTYKVMAEVPGMFTYPASITLSEESPYVEDISIVVYYDEIAYGIGNDIGTRIAGLGDLYPNPAREYTKLEFNLLESGHVQIFILNQAGQVADKYSINCTTGNHILQLNTSGLSAGMYRVMVLFGNEKHIRPFIKVN
jgi:PKD repeat protein